MPTNCPTGTLTGCAFAQYLVDQQPVYDKLILEDIRPTDSWILNVKTGTFDAYSGTSHVLDRFRSVFPDTTRAWNRTDNASCHNNQCDKVENCIGWGGERINYYLEEQSWATPLLCYDQMMHVTHAREHFRQIITSILKPATTAIMSGFLRKRALQVSGLLSGTGIGNNWTANATMTPFTFNWSSIGVGDEGFFDCSVNPATVFLLTPQMLQRRTTRLWGEGYDGKMPFKDYPAMIELVTDIDTCWSLDRLGGTGGNGSGGNSPTLVGNWRFTEWDAAHKWWRYGFSGQMGNYAVRVDPMGMRFNFVRDLGAAAAPNRYRYQVVLPYVNNATTGMGIATFGTTQNGLGSNWNPDYDNAQFAISHIWHKSGMEALVADATPVNPEMPFSSRNFGGRWQFVMDNLGADCNGRPIENKRRNKGQFIGDFKLAIRPLYHELTEGIFHKRERPCVYEIAPCNPDPGYPTQKYSSCNDVCTNICT